MSAATELTLPFAGSVRALDGLPCRAYAAQANVPVDFVEPAGWLTSAEQQSMPRACSGERRREWLGGRLLVKQILLDEGLVDDPCEVEVMADLRGRPSVRRTGCASPLGDCSITHKRGRVAALFTPDAHYRVGIDLEQVSSNFARLESCFMNADDDTSSPSDRALNAAVGWTLREGFSKATGQAFAVLFDGLRCSRDGARWLIQHPSGAVAQGVVEEGRGWITAWVSIRTCILMSMGVFA
ncbi:MAG: hypothetical protein V1929_04185 [bacterium]